MKTLLFSLLLLSSAVAQTHTFCATDTNCTTTGNNVHNGSETFNGSLAAGAGTFTSVTVGNVNNRIYVDGVKYPITQAGIQQAFTDACAGTFGGAVKGTFVLLPPMNLVVATGFTITCPIHVIGAGLGQTTLNATTGPLFTLSPSANFSQNQDWEIAYGDWDTGTGNVIVFSDANGFALNHLRVHDSEFGSGSTSALGIQYLSTITNAGFDWQIYRNYFFVPISLTSDSSSHGLVDGLRIYDNTFDGGTTTTNACMNLTSGSGAAQWTIFHNRGGCAGGVIIYHGTAQCKIIYNQFEQTVSNTETNGAMIDLLGDTAAIDNCEIRGNNLNMHTFATSALRIGSASHTVVSSNTFSGTGTDVVASAGTNSVIYTPDNESTASTKGLVPTCSTSTGLGTGFTCTITSNSGSPNSFFVTATAGTSASSSGIFAFTFPVSWPNGAPNCTVNLRSGSGTWNARATVIGSTSNTSKLINFSWDNNSVALTSSSAYDAYVQCSPQ